MSCLDRPLIGVKLSNWSGAHNRPRSQAYRVRRGAEAREPGIGGPHAVNQEMPNDADAFDRLAHVSVVLCWKVDGAFSAVALHNARTTRPSPE